MLFLSYTLIENFHFRKNYDVRFGGGGKRMNSIEQPATPRTAAILGGLTEGGGREN